MSFIVFPLGVSVVRAPLTLGASVSLVGVIEGSTAGAFEHHVGNLSGGNATGKNRLAGSTGEIEVPLTTDDRFIPIRRCQNGAGALGWFWNHSQWLVHVVSLRWLRTTVEHLSCGVKG
jgi:hypothetical protein